MNKFSGNSLDVKVEEAIAEIKRRANAVKAEMHNPMFEALIDKYVDAGLNDKELTYTLPDCEATNILRKITDKYKGKYVYLDFWATFCAPCRSGIEQSKAWREEVRNNPDFEFVYITGDKSSPKTTYEEYVAQNLNGAECYRIPEEDYKKLKVLFKFTGFPHHEALDPNGNVLKVNNTYYEGKDVFLRKIETMKRMQEK
jgi:thiol-disulfide isomerase/thioredoxin